MSEPLSAEDAKLVTLARAARVRTGALEGAAVRDDIGRTYVATTVALSSLRLSALEAAVAAAVSSGAQVLEAAVVVTPAAGRGTPVVGTAAVGELGGVREVGAVPVHVVSPDGVRHVVLP